MGKNAIVAHIQLLLMHGLWYCMQRLQSAVRVCEAAQVQLFFTIKTGASFTLHELLAWALIPGTLLIAKYEWKTAMKSTSSVTAHSPKKEAAKAQLQTSYLNPEDRHSNARPYCLLCYSNALECLTAMQ